MAALDENLKERLQNLSPDALYEIKKLLRSRRVESQLFAVRVLESCLHGERVTAKCPLRQFMLEEDMVGFLCDAMASNSWPLLERVTAVMELLLDCDEMLLGGHAVLAAEAAHRRAHFLGLMVGGTSTDCESALRAVLDLLAALLVRWSEVPSRGGMMAGRSLSNLCPPLGLLATLRQVLDAGKLSSSTSTTMTAARTLSGLLPLIAVGAEPGDPANLAARIASCARAALDSLQRLLLVEDRFDAEEACVLICCIAARVTQLRVRCDETPENDDASMTLQSLELEAQQVVVEKCVPMAVQEARSSIEEALNRTMDTPSDEDEQTGQPAMTSAMLDALQTGLDLGKDPVGLADILACHEFLWLLPTLHRTSPDSPQALQLLCGMLAHLAHDLLDAARWWSGAGGKQPGPGESKAGADTLAAFLGTAAPLLSVDNREWPRVLERWSYVSLAPLGPWASAPAAAQLLILLLAYFRNVAGSACDPEEMQCIASSLPAYIMSLPGGKRTCSGIEPVAPSNVLKMVWLSFAVHCVLATDAPSAEARAANARLTQILDQASIVSVDALRSIYTHHPSLLYWAFQSKSVPPRLQMRILQLWLCDGDTVTTAAPVKEIVLAQRQAVHPLLDVVATGDAPAADTAATLLVQAVAASEAVAADLRAGLWDRLPLELSRSGPANGCGLLVWLAAEVYSPPPADLALRVASLLAGALGKQRLGTIPRNLTAALFVLRKLLDYGRSSNDPRVLTTLLSDARFAQAMLVAADDEDFQLCTMAMHLLRQLEEDNALLKTPILPSPVPFELKSVLFAVTCKDFNVVEAGLFLLLEVLKEKPHRFLLLKPDDMGFRALYFQLQNSAIKLQAVPHLRDTVWTALKELLTKSEMLPHQPWNHVLISFFMKQTPLHNLSSKFFDFVFEWLWILTPENPPEPTPRRPIPSMLTETVTKIAYALIDAEAIFLELPIVRNIAKALLEVTANLPTSLETRVKELLGPK